MIIYSDSGREVETDNLLTVNNFAKMCDITPSFVYILEKRGKIELVMIDGVAFVDKEQYKSFAETKSTKKALNKLKSLIKNKKNEQKHNIAKKPSI